MVPTFFQFISCTARGAAIGFAVGLSAALFGSLIGTPFSVIWASGMPIATASVGAIVFALLSGIGMHNGFRDDVESLVAIKYDR